MVKRDGSRSAFDISRIERAVSNCFHSLEEYPATALDQVVTSLATTVASRFGAVEPTVEQIQDLVEVTLLSFGEVEAARHYMSYRDEHAAQRAVSVPDEVRAAFDEDRKYFATAAQRFTFYDKYSRFNWELMRRETWPETVARTVDHLRWEVRNHIANQWGCDIDSVTDADLPVSALEFARINEAILTMKVMPSMRLLAMAGEAARRNSMSLYNCSYLPVQDIQSFVEAMLVSMAGCGVGFSVESKYVEQFPRIARQKAFAPRKVHVIEDTTEGWAEALRTGLTTWWSGGDLEFIYDGIRPAGAVLKTKGGRASGPEPLKKMMAFLKDRVLSRQGSYLRTTDAHIMMCAVGEAAVQGGMRRTAMISLFDYDDVEMRTVKQGTFDPLLWNANNSAVWPDEITDVQVAMQMLEMAVAKSGEPGIFSRTNAVKTMPIRRDPNHEFGTNPCGEIILRPFQFCNLTQAVARQGDTEEILREKTELASLVGTIQSLATNFPGMRPEWKANCEEERLLGVDLTAQVDCELLRSDNIYGADLRDRLTAYALEVNEKWAAKLGINVSASITCNKPAGNSAELLESSNGIHARHSAYLRRRMTVGADGPLFRVLRGSGVPMEPKAGSTPDNATQWIASFARKSPEGATLKGNLSAVDQCEFWLLNKEHWTEHNPSCTITYKEDEIIDLIQWVCLHKDRIAGLSFFPYSDAAYVQQPFEEITAEEYDQLMSETPDIDFSLLYAYEHTDMTTAAQTLACFSGNGDCAVG